MSDDENPGDDVHEDDNQNEGRSKQSSSIHTERYIPWQGKPRGRPWIIINGIREGFRYNFQSKWVKTLVILAWVFIVFFPLLRAMFGELTLLQDPEENPFRANPDEAYDIIMTYGMDFPHSQSIEPGELAVYNLTVMNTGERPDMVHLNITWVDWDWGAALRRFGENETDQGLVFALQAGELARFQLRVYPPGELFSGQGVVIVEARSEGASVVGAGLWDLGKVTHEVRTLTVVGQTEASAFHFTMTAGEPWLRVKAGSTVEFTLNLTNTGTEPDNYTITAEGVPTEWVAWFSDLDGLDEGIGVLLAPGESRVFTVNYEAPDYPMRISYFGVVARSMNDQTLAGGVVTVVEVYGIEPQDMTGRRLADPDEGLFGGLFMIFTMFLSAMVGSKAISADLKQKSLTIYFARPLRKIDYVAIKFGATGATLALVTLVPVLVTFTGLLLLSDVGFDYLLDHLWVWGAIGLYALLVTTLFTSLALAFSALTVRRFYAAFGLVATYLASAIIAGIITGDFNDDRGSMVSIIDSLQLVGTKIFDIPNYYYAYDWIHNLYYLLGVITLATTVVMLKVWRTELSE